MSVSLWYEDINSHETRNKTKNKLSLAQFFLLVTADYIFVSIYPSIREPFLCEVFFQRKDLENSTRKDDNGLNDSDKDDFIVDFDVSLGKFILWFAVHLLVLDEFFRSGFHNIHFLLQLCDMALLSSIFLHLLFLISNH